MSSHFYIKHRLVGGTEHSLDALNTFELKHGDVALTVSEGYVFFHRFSTKSQADHNPPSVVKPRNNNYKRRWLLTDYLVGNYDQVRSMFKGFSFFGEPSPPDTSSPYFYIWQSDGKQTNLGFDGDVFAKIRNRKGVVQQVMLADFSEMEIVSDIKNTFDTEDVSERRKIHIRDKAKLENPSNNVKTLFGIAQEDLEVGDLGIAFDSSSIAFYFASSRGYEENFPYVFYPYSRYSPITEPKRQMCWVLSGVVGDLIFRDGPYYGNSGVPLDKEPPNPPNGSYVMWVDDGSSRLGQRGDVHLKVTNTKGSTKYERIVDFSRIEGYPVLEDLHISVKDGLMAIIETVDEDKENPSLDFGYSSDGIVVGKYSVVSDENGSISYSFELGMEKHLKVEEYGDGADGIVYLEKTKYILVHETHLLNVPIKDVVNVTAYYDKSVSEDVAGLDRDKVYVYINLEELVTADDLFTSEAQVKTKDRIFYREKPIKVVLDFAAASDIISYRKSETITQAFGTESLNIWNSFQVQEEAEPDERAWNSRIYCIVDDIISKSLGYNFSISEEAAPTVDKPDITVDFSTGTTTPTFYGSSFEVSGDDTSNYTHVASDWKVLSEDGGLIFKSLDDTSNLTELQMPSSTLFEGNTYVVYLRYEEQDLGKGSWGRKWFEV